MIGIKIIESVLHYQQDVSSAVYHGTFKRFPEELKPVGNPIIWRDYGPNWCEFICTVFIILLQEFVDLFPDELIEQMNHSILLT